MLDSFFHELQIQVTKLIKNLLTCEYFAKFAEEIIEDGI